MKVWVFATACSLVLFQLSCQKKSDDASDGAEATSNISESVVAEAGQQATASEGSGSITLQTAHDIGFEVSNLDFVDPQTLARPSSACSLATARSTCSSNVDTISWSSCSVGTATLSGGWTETWTNGFCSNGSQPGVLTSGNSVTRTSSGQTLTFASGAKIVTDTSAHSTYDSTSIPSTGITVSNSSGTRTITVNGMHKVMTGPFGRTWFDHSITGALTVTGTRAGSNRVVSGTSTMYHNLAKYTAAHTFNSVTWGNSTCCYPTSGNVSSTLTGTGRSGTVSLAFSSTCGTATFTDTNGTASTISLAQCN